MLPEHAAAESKPYGYVRVRYGRIRPSDLVYSWPTEEWLRHDSPEWSSTCEWASEAVYVIRKSTEPETKKETAKDDLEYENLIPAQQGLFSGF